jgi:hypothetical protein
MVSCGFPVQCKELLDRYRGLANAIESAPAPKQHQAAEPATSAQSPSSNKANAKAEDVSPSGEDKPGSAIQDKNVVRRSLDSYSRNEERWFNPLKFR